ncbi:MAG: hypothetical protein AB7Q00_15055 [Phycisphaerales bacterium]
MSVQFRNALTDQYARGQTITGDEFNLPADCVALEVRIRRDTTATAADGVWKDPGYVGVTLLRSSDGKNWVESGYFGTVGGKQTDVDYKGEIYEHQYAGIVIPIYRDGWVFKLKVDSPAAQKLPFEIYYHIADKGRPPLAIDPRNSVGFVDGDNTIGTSVTTLQNPNDVAVSGSNKAIYAQITYYNAASRTVSSSKWGGSGGANMTEVQATTINASMRGYDYRMLNSGISAAAKVYVTMSGACTKLALTVWSWNEVDQTTPEDDLTGTRYSTGAISASASDTLNTASGGKCIFQACGWVDYGVVNWTPLYSPTGSEINTNGNNPAFLSDYYSSTGATQQVGVTGASSYGYGNSYVLGHGLALNEASAGGPSTEIASGALSSGAADVTGAAFRQLPTSGALASGAADVSGAAVRELPASGALSSGAADVSGSATQSAEKAAAGALTSGDASVSGTAIRELVTSGALASSNAIIVSAAVRELPASGALTSGDSAVDGAAVISGTVAGGGNLQAGDADITGAVVRTLLSAGVIEAGEATLAGGAIRTLLASGTLEAGDSSIAGGTLPASTLNRIALYYWLELI